jgi:hypothetical protein
MKKKKKMNLGWVVNGERHHAQAAGRTVPLGAIGREERDRLERRLCSNIGREERDRLERRLCHKHRRRTAQF